MTLGTVVWGALGALVVLGGLTVRRRLGELREDEEPGLDEAAIASIVETGTLTVDEEPPLDLDEIEEEEERFWSEPWDEPEEW